MTKTRHYVPTISRSLVRVLYHEGKRRRMPMTRLVDELLTKALSNTYPKFPSKSAYRPKLSTLSAVTR